MNRRELIAGLALSTTLLGTNLKSIGEEISKKVKIKPKALKIGDNIGVVAPASNVSDPEDIAKALDVLYNLGLKPKLSPLLTDGKGYKTKSAEDRAKDLMAMFEDKEVNGIMCIRGGYGSAGILKHIDFKVIADNPKIFCGYSDITALHLAIQNKTGLVTFHSPVLLSPFTAMTEESFRKNVFGLELGVINNPSAKRSFRELNAIRTISTGIAKGELTGGNLSIICSLMGTSYEIFTENRILFIEDVEEPAYRIDRMLTQLELAGKLDNLAGVVIGKCEGCKNDGQGSLWDRSIGEVYDYFFKNKKYPVFSGMLIGHTQEQITLPYGINVEIDSTKGTIKYLEKQTI
jgi:muramoyltetrapeptide carboxypeptidase